MKHLTSTIIKSLLLLVVALLSVSFCQATTFYVTTITDDPVAGNLTTPTPGSLRWAVIQSRLDMNGPHEIKFAIPDSEKDASGFFIWQPSCTANYGDELKFTNQTTIDGLSQPGAYPGYPLIVLDNSNLCHSTNTAIEVNIGVENIYETTLGDLMIEGLVFTNWSQPGTAGVGAINANNGNNVQIRGSYFGIRPDGVEGPVFNGFVAANTGGHVIGGPAATDRNYFANANNAGVALYNCFDVEIHNNYFGVTQDDIAAGNDYIANYGDGAHGIIANNCTGVEIHDNRVENHDGSGIIVGYGSTDVEIYHNISAHNSGSGVTVVEFGGPGPDNVHIYQNSIFCNALEGIDLDAVSNSGMEAHTPVIDGLAPLQNRVFGTYSGPTPAEIELYGVSSECPCTAANNNQGATFLMSVPAIGGSFDFGCWPPGWESVVVVAVTPTRTTEFSEISNLLGSCDMSEPEFTLDAPEKICEGTEGVVTVLPNSDLSGYAGSVTYEYFVDGSTSAISGCSGTSCDVGGEIVPPGSLVEVVATLNPGGCGDIIQITEEVLVLMDPLPTDPIIPDGCPSGAVVDISPIRLDQYTLVQWSGGTGSFSPAQTTGDLNTSYSPGAGETGDITVSLYYETACGSGTVPVSINVDGLGPFEYFRCDGQGFNYDFLGTLPAGWSLFVNSDPGGNTVGVVTGDLWFYHTGDGVYDITLSQGTCQVNTTLTYQRDAPDLIVDVTDPGCTGTPGEITVTHPTLGETFNYLRADGANFNSGQTHTGLSIGNYNITAQDGSQCVFDTTVSLIAPDPLTIEATGNDVSCNGGNDGDATVTITGGGSGTGQTYSWDVTGVTGASPSGLSQGSYTVTVTDDAGCEDDATVVIDEPDELELSATTTHPICQQTNGEIEIDAIGGTSPYEYQLGSASFQSGNSFTGLAEGSFTIIVRDDNSCTEAIDVELIDVPASAIDNVAVVDETCDNSNGEISITASGTNTPFQYSIDGGANFQPSNFFLGIPAGSYDVVVRDANTCEVEDVAVISNTPGPEFTDLLVIDPSCGLDNGAVTTVSATGTTAIEFALDGGSFGTATSYPALAEGNHTITARDENGCTTDTTFELIDQAGPVISNQDFEDPSCELPNGTIDVEATGGTGQLQWTLNGGTQELSGSFVDLAPMTYQVHVEDENGCRDSVDFTLNNQASPEIVNASPTNANCNDTDGFIFVEVTGGTPTLEYSAGSGFDIASTLVGLGAGNYTVTVRDANGCEDETDVTVDENNAPVIDDVLAVEPICTEPNGELTIEASQGTGPYSYSVDGGTTFQADNNFDGLAEGNYAIVVEGSDGCRISGTADLTDSPGPTLDSVEYVHPTCLEANGEIDIVAMGGTAPLQYSFDGSAFANQTRFTGLAAGNYDFTIRDANGCEALGIASPSNLNGPQISDVIFSDPTCGNDNGTITIEAEGGVGVLRYSIDNGIQIGAQTQYDGLAEGSYSIIVIDDNDCPAADNVELVNQLGPVVGVVTSEDVSCFEGQDGSAEVTYSLGTQPVDITWSNGATGVSLNNVTAGNYTVNFEDVNGCVADASIEVVEPVVLEAAEVVVDASCFGFSDGSVDVSISGGNSGYSFSWSNSSSTEDISGLAAGDYILLVQDAKGCQVELTASVGQPSEEPESISFDKIKEGSCDDPMTLFEMTEVVSGNANPSWEWYFNGSPTGETGETYQINEILNNDEVKIVMDPSVCTLEPEVVSDVFDGEKVKCTCDLWVPTAISPNGDGANEGWNIDGLDCWDDYQVRVYNRYGNKVYESYDYIPWDGNRNGSSMPVGTYYYVIDVQADGVDKEKKYVKKEYTGPITVMR